MQCLISSKRERKARRDEMRGELMGDTMIGLVWRIQRMNTKLYVPNSMVKEDICCDGSQRFGKLD